MGIGNGEPNLLPPGFDLHFLSDASYFVRSEELERTDSARPISFSMNSANSPCAPKECLRTRPLALSAAAEICFSVRSEKEESPSSGQEAMKASAHMPDQYIDCFKRMIGRDTVKAVNGIDVPPEICNAILLLHLKKYDEAQIGPVRQAVISVPAFFDESRRRATQVAGRLAGFEVLDIINEPTAAAICHAYQNNLGENEEPRTVMVYDLGGGTFDITILQIDGDDFRTLATDGDVLLGGRDFDQRMVDYLAGQFASEHGFDPREIPFDHAQLWLDAEEIKKSLSKRSSYTHTMFFKGVRCKTTITRELYQELTIDLIRRTGTTTNLALKQANLEWTQIDEIVLAGGSSRMPMVAQMLEQMSGRAISISVMADLMVGYGAAIYASMLDNRPTGRKPNLINVNSHSLRIVGINQQTKQRTAASIIPKNTPLPCSVVRKFVTAKNNQRSVHISVVEGESSDPSSCISLGSCVIRDLPPELMSGSEVIAQFNYRSNGTITVEARIPETRQSASARINSTKEKDLGTLSQWIFELTGQEDGYLDDQKRLQMIDDELTELGKLSIDSEIGHRCVAQRNAVLEVLRKKVEVDSKFKKLKISADGDLLDHGKLIKVQSKLAFLAN